MNLTRISSLFLCTVFAISAGCSKESAHSANDGHDHESAPASGASSHGVAGAVPGSYEDWCGAHSVPESKCTRCNPALAAAFKATGDWCGEHGLPESHCVQCDPSRKLTRPPKE